MIYWHPFVMPVSAFAAFYGLNFSIIMVSARWVLPLERLVYI